MSLLIDKPAKELMEALYDDAQMNVAGKCKACGSNVLSRPMILRHATWAENFEGFTVVEEAPVIITTVNKATFWRCSNKECKHSEAGYTFESNSPEFNAAYIGEA